MSKLLDNSSRPLWVWVVVIIIGSLLILGIVTWVTRCWIIRRKARSDVEIISDEPAEKKLTLRRGRIVPATSYLSLTGSRFGVAAFTGDDGRESPSVRSKSPFEWWSNLRSRSSRLSYVSHISSSPYPSRNSSIYQRPDLSTSKLSLTSKDDGVRSTTTEIKITKPQAMLHVSSFSRSSRNFEPVNFSRAFTPQTQRSLVAHRNQTLSRIEESTPRQSVFSTTSFKIRSGSVTLSDHGQAAEYPASRHVSAASHLKVPVQSTHSRQISNNSIIDILSQHADQDNPLVQHPPNIPSPHPPSPTTPTFPLPVADPTTPASPRNSVWVSSMRQFPSLEQHQHQHPYQHQHTSTDYASSQISFPSPVEPYSYSEIQPPHPDQHHTAVNEIDEQYPQSRPHSQSFPHLPIGPLRTQSSKGNVLRKKSIERTRVRSGFV